MAVELGDNADTFMRTFSADDLGFSVQCKQIRTENSVCKKWTISYLKFKVNIM